MHRYLYAGARPTFFVDPTGHFSVAEEARWWGNFAIGFGSAAWSQTGKVIGATGKALVNTAIEAPKVIADAGVVGFEAVTGVDTGIGLLSDTAKGSAARMARGDSTADITQDTAIGVLKNATNYVVVEEQLNAYADYRTGRATLSDLEDRFAEAAGQGAANAILAKGAQRAYQAAQARAAAPSTALESGRGPVATAEGPIIDMVRNADGVYVPSFEVPGGSTALATTRPVALTAPLAPRALPAFQPRALFAPVPFDDIVAANYQRYYNDAAGVAVRRFNQGQISIPSGMPWETTIGQHVDAAARARLRGFLRRQGVAEGPGEDVAINRWLRDPSGSGRYRIPDVRLDQSRRILDGTIGNKRLTDPQASDFVTFSGGYDVTFVRPQTGPLSRR